MAIYKRLIPHILKWEGGISNDPNDSGGFTNAGVTIATWRKLGKDNNADGVIDEKDLELITRQEWEYIFKTYWDKCRADDIKNQITADIIVDWYWGSGTWATKRVQKVLNSMGSKLVVDGIIGAHTLAEIAQYDKGELNRRLQYNRLVYYYDIARPQNRKFLRGWINRAQDLVKNRMPRINYVKVGNINYAV